MAKPRRAKNSELRHTLGSRRASAAPQLTRTKMSSHQSRCVAALKWPGGTWTRAVCYVRSRTDLENFADDLTLQSGVASTDQSGRADNSNPLEAAALPAKSSQLEWFENTQNLHVHLNSRCSQIAANAGPAHDVRPATAQLQHRPTQRAIRAVRTEPRTRASPVVYPRLPKCAHVSDECIANRSRRRLSCNPDPASQVRASQLKLAASAAGQIT